MSSCAACADGTTCDDGSVACSGGQCICNAGGCVSGCLASGVVYGAGADDPGDACRVCDPAQSTTGFSPRADGTACSGGVCSAGQCTAGCLIAGVLHADGDPDPQNACAHCDAAVSTSGWTPVADGAACPDDGNTCTLDLCTTGNCGHPAASAGTPCGASGQCDASGTCSAQCTIGGALVADGTVNPANPCQLCDTKRSTTAWSPGPGGAACGGAGQICNASGQCLAGCQILGAFYADGVANPANPCQVCRAASATAAWSAAAEGTGCGADQCGSWSSCDYAGACDTTGDQTRTCAPRVCSAGACVAGTSHQDTRACSRGSQDGATCADDGLACTLDVCSGGGCTHPTGNVGAACGGAGQICDPTGQCTAGCDIGGTFYADGQANPANACQVCRSASSTQAWAGAGDGTTCGPDQCGGWSSCAFPDTCAAVGDQSRSCAPQVCAAGACVAGQAHPETQACSRGARDGVTCDDLDACTADDRCSGGTCRGTPYSCPGDQCHVGSCDGQGTCNASPRPDGTACNDGDLCTQGDVCTGGICGGQSYTCAAPNQCQASVACDGTGGCTYVNKSNGTGCDDGDICTFGDHCLDGACTGTASNCGDPPPGSCIQALACNGHGGCIPISKPDGAPCDPSACSYGACQSGQCVACAAANSPGECCTSSSTQCHPPILGICF